MASVHAHSSSVTWATCFEHVDRPSLGCLRRTEPEDVATADGVEVILDTLAEAFQCEHKTELFDALEDTFYGLGRERSENSMTMHFGYKATYGSWPSKEYGCQTKYRGFFCYAERT